MTVRREEGELLGLEYDSQTMRIVSLTTGKPADRAVLRVGWGIIRIAGRPVRSGDEYGAAISSVGTEFDITLRAPVSPGRARGGSATRGKLHKHVPHEQLPGQIPNAHAESNWTSVLQPQGTAGGDNGPGRVPQQPPGQPPSPPTSPHPLV